MRRTPLYGLVEMAAELPAFCGVCGLSMNSDDHVSGYDRKTGLPIREVAVRCPRGRFDDGHEAFLVSPRPKAPAPPPDRD